MTTHHASAEGMADLRSCPFCGQSDRLALQNLVDEDDFSVCCDRCDVTQHAIHTEAAAIAAWNRRANPWVSVAERLPEEDVKVLVWRKNEAMVGQRNGEYWVLTPGVWTCRDVTHWMPIPPLTPMTQEERG
jgi:Lar family restriction alleviation protein